MYNMRKDNFSWQYFKIDYKFCQNYSGAHYVKNISYLFDTVLLRIQADSYKHIH